eukprot:910301-Prymnesium_polylepis.2
MKGRSACRPARRRSSRCWRSPSEPVHPERGGTRRRRNASRSAAAQIAARLRRADVRSSEQRRQTPSRPR